MFSNLSPLLVMMLGFAPSAILAQDDFPGVGHEYIPPTDIFTQRGPCPAVNTLANHGFINRNGTNISVGDLTEAVEAVFGLSEFLGDRIIQAANIEPDGTFDLADLYAHDSIEHDASLVREDFFFDPLAQFNESLFEQMVQSAASNERITQAELASFQAERITDSRRNNPEVSFEGSDTSALIGEAFALFLFGDDPDIASVTFENLRSFLGPNRFPDGFVPRQSRGLGIIRVFSPSLLSAAMRFVWSVNRALASDLTVRRRLGTPPTKSSSMQQIPTASEE